MRDAAGGGRKGGGGGRSFKPSADAEVRKNNETRGEQLQTDDTMVR